MELQGLVWDILGRYPELHSGFSDILARCESMDFECNDARKNTFGGKMSAKELLGGRLRWLQRAPGGRVHGGYGCGVNHAGARSRAGSR